MKNHLEIKTELESKFRAEIVLELLNEFKSLRTANWTGDDLKTIIHGGRFSELAIVAIFELSNNSNTDLNQIKFGQLYNLVTNLKKSTPQEEMLYQIIPSVLNSIYTIRNKKNSAHFKLNNLDKIDSEYVMTSCGWVVSQFILLFSSKNSQDVIAFTNSIMEKRIPTIEVFDNGELMILKRGLKFGEELLLLLYYFSKRLSNGELSSVLKPKKQSYIPTYLKILYEKKLIHLNNDGAIINKNGVVEIENNRNKYF